MSRQARILIRYALFQIPSLVLLILILIMVRLWVGLPEWFFWGAIVVWLVKDVILFPFVWRAYDRDRSRELQSLVGTEGIVEERLAPSGYVRVHGEFWQAEMRGDGPPIEKEEIVKIQKDRGAQITRRTPKRKRRSRPMTPPRKDSRFTRETEVVDSRITGHVPRE
jgi:membrane protein implicated in regulation of membrane protease activity